MPGSPFGLAAGVRSVARVASRAPLFALSSCSKPREVLETLGQELRTLYGPPQDLPQELSILLKELETACALVTDGWP